MRGGDEKGGRVTTKRSLYLREYREPRMRSLEGKKRNQKEEGGPKKVRQLTEKVKDTSVVAWGRPVGRKGWRLRGNRFPMKKGRGDVERGNRKPQASLLFRRVFQGQKSTTLKQQRGDGGIRKEGGQGGGGRSRKKQKSWS